METQNFTATPFETGIATSQGIDLALNAFLTGIKQVNYAAIPGNADDPIADRSWMWQYCSEYGALCQLCVAIFVQLAYNCFT